MNHSLKTWPEFFDAILKGEKTFEVRKNDRGFKVGDHLTLQEWDSGHDPLCPRCVYLLADESCSCDPGQFTGRLIEMKVTYLTDFAQRAGFVVMAIAKV